MRDDREQWVQQRAYAIWEAEGRPDGRDREHWEQAERERPTDEASVEASVAADAVPEPGSIKKPRKRAATKTSASTGRSGKKKAAELHP